MTQTSNKWLGYKFVGDNIDKNIRPRYQRHNMRGQSLHYFHGYAVKDRVNLSELLDKPPARTMPKSSVFIPSLSDLTSLKEELAILIARCVYTYNSISHTPKCMYMCTITCEKTNKYVCISLFRVLVQHMSCFKDQSKLVVTHIPSRHSKEMERKSEVVRTL